MDLRAACYGPTRVGVRRLRALIEHLPPEAVSRDQPEWTVDNELAAQAIETMGEIIRVLVATMRMWAGKKASSRVPIPDSLVVPRPESVLIEREGARLRQQPADEYPPRLRTSGRSFARALMGGMTNG